MKILCMQQTNKQSYLTHIKYRPISYDSKLLRKIKMTFWALSQHSEKNIRSVKSVAWQSCTNNINEQRKLRSIYHAKKALIHISWYYFRYMAYEAYSVKVWSLCGFWFLYYGNSDLRNKNPRAIDKGSKCSGLPLRPIQIIA